MLLILAWIIPSKAIFQNVLADCQLVLGRLRPPSPACQIRPCGIQMQKVFAALICFCWEEPWKRAAQETASNVGQ